MNEEDAPGPRIAAAKNAAHEFIDALPDAASIALQTYGTNHGTSEGEKSASCEDVTTLLPLGPLDRTDMEAAIDGIIPSGFTPINLALQHAVDQLPDGDAQQAVVLVSDGEETCDVPPCATAAQLKELRPGLTISTVGFRVDGTAADQLACIADASDGISVQASNARQLVTRLLATQDIDRAGKSLSASGIFDIDLGGSLDDIRAKHRGFPDVSPEGRVVVEWLNCDFGFQDGILGSIRPHTGSRTIDGLGIGYPKVAADDFYGAPLKAVSNGDGTITFTYDADPHSDAAYQITVHATGLLTGHIKSIVLCLCKPRAGGAPDQSPVITEDTVLNMTFPAGTCGDGYSGWSHDAPITVTNGDGESRTASGEFGGASIREAKLIGLLDADEDGVEEAVVSFVCFGSTFAMCCAGRSSNMLYVGVFDFTDPLAPQAIGETIRPGVSPVRGEKYGESRYIDEVRVASSAIIAYEKLIYADTSGATADLDHSPYATIEVTHRFSDGEWVSTERVIG
ncbi:hypothetical protein BRW64_19010 [Mycolicibacterium diernhoferi]|nr:hypothetical protein BRW64_19010 [Mycolicibacterium diernhoferi]